MPQRVKYPLTVAAKEYARQLVKAWDEQQIGQVLYIAVMTALSDREVELMYTLGVEGDVIETPKLGVIRELMQYGLISAIDLEDRFEITLLQELRNAVENDFEVSDFFLTTSAVGTIIYGNLEVREGAYYQSGAVGIGDLHQSIEGVADQLEKVLGAEILQQEPALSAAITELRSADQLIRNQKLGSVVQELGHCLDHLGNAGAAIIALQIITQYLS